MNNIILWIALFPLIGFLINGLFGHKWREPWSGIIATSATAASFVLGVVLFFHLMDLHHAERIITASYFTWLNVGSLAVDFAFRVDPVSITMILVVTGVGSLIHLYSIGYMAKDKGFARYFAYLNLFIFMMLILVMASNLPLMFVGWEGVGLCSYLLIGFWYEDPAKASAGKKAFIVNRIGDACFLLGMFLLFKTVGTLEFSSIERSLGGISADTVNVAALTLVGLLLFGGAIGKSAQLPLYVWLPDAMAGPTPVSALIHAATMVTAGVYLIIRMSALYLLAPIAMKVIAVVGIVTAVYAALIALSQNDIKKVLAYSTVSQLGYMFAAVGVGAFAAGLFHLVTHAFFKALLFLGSGSVIHALSGEQDIWNMGGLHKKMPITSWTFLVGVLAISGIPFLSGFFSKDAILWYAASSVQGGWHIYFIGAVTAFLTAVYMFRLYAITFMGSARKEGFHPHESPPSMALPLIILAALAVAGGIIGLPEWIHLPNLLEGFIEPVVRTPEVIFEHGMEIILTIVAVLIACSAIVFGFWIFVRNPAMRGRITSMLGPLPKWSMDKFYVDELYDYFVVVPVRKTGEICWRVFDATIIDGSINMFAKGWRAVSGAMSAIQRGNVQSYALWIVIGALLLILAVMKG